MCDLAMTGKCSAFEVTIYKFSIDVAKDVAHAMSLAYNLSVWCGTSWDVV
jgi:hypothetical protein